MFSRITPGSACPYSSRFAVDLLRLGWMVANSCQCRTLEQYTIQRMSRGLAQHISSHSVLMDPHGIDRQNLGKLFDMPSGGQPGHRGLFARCTGRILAHQAPEGHVKVQQI